MTPDARYIFEVLERAEVSILHFSKLTNISRTTLHNWKRGGTVRDQVRFRIAMSLAQRLDHAVTIGKLPLKAVRPKERLGVLKQIIRGLG